MPNNQRVIKRYLRKTKWFCFLLQIVPFVRCVILNGSLATGSVKKSSDIDLLIITKSGRIFTVRFLVNLLAIISGQKRSSDESKSHAGKFCFNYFLTTSYLIIDRYQDEQRNQYCAENYSRSTLVWGDKGMFERFMKENSDLLAQIQSANFKMQIDNTKWKNYFPIKTTPLYFIGRLKELILSGWLGDKLEQGLKKIQINKIEKDPRTKKYPELIVYNNKELRFHPPKN